MTQPSRADLIRLGAEHQAMRMALLRDFDRIKRLARTVEPHAGKRAQLIRIPAAVR